MSVAVLRISSLLRINILILDTFTSLIDTAKLQHPKCRLPTITSPTNYRDRSVCFLYSRTHSLQSLEHLLQSPLQTFAARSFKSAITRLHTVIICSTLHPLFKIATGTTLRTSRLYMFTTDTIFKTSTILASSIYWGPRWYLRGHRSLVLGLLRRVRY